MSYAEHPVRREGDRELPLGPKAARTRQAILEAAATTFTEQGYQRSSVADVAAAAGVSLGTVYQYFRDRSDLVAALVRRNVRTMLDRTDSQWRADEGLAGLRRVIGNFVSSYADVARLAGVWEEVSHVDDTLAELRRSLGRAFTTSVEVELRRATALGLVRPDIDPAIDARALTGMVDRYCYVTYVFDPPPGGTPAAEHSSDQLARLWAGAIGLRTGDDLDDRTSP